MNSPFQFPCDEMSLEYLIDALAHLVALGVDREEGIARLNARWSDVTVNPEVVGHEEPEYWANDALFGHDSFWWIEESMAVPLPLPNPEYWPNRKTKVRGP